MIQHKTTKKASFPMGAIRERIVVAQSMFVYWSSMCCNRYDLC